MHKRSHRRNIFKLSSTLHGPDSPHPPAVVRTCSHIYPSKRLRKFRVSRWTSDTWLVFYVHKIKSTHDWKLQDRSLVAQNRGDIMATEMFLSFHGLLLPKETHDPESLKFAQDFTFKDNDVLAVTYPKSGQCFFRLNHAGVAWVNMSNSSHINYGKKLMLESRHHFRPFFEFWNHLFE